MKLRLITTMALLTVCIDALNQNITMQDLVNAFERDTSITLQRIGVVIESYPFSSLENAQEAIAFRPTSGSVHPALLIIPGYGRTSRDYIPVGLNFAKNGYACIIITQLGFGRSQGKADFVGPSTLAALVTGFSEFLGENYIDRARVGIYGYSRGAMAASLLASNQLADITKAAVFGAGIYDLRKAYDEIEDAEILENISNESGSSEQAFNERSSILRMSRLKAPVLILHGAKDESAPVSQAKMLDSKLTELEKVHELEIFPDKDHNLGMAVISDHIIPFFDKYLKY